MFNLRFVLPLAAIAALSLAISAVQAVATHRNYRCSYGNQPDSNADTVQACNAIGRSICQDSNYDAWCKQLNSDQVQAFTSRCRTYWSVYSPNNGCPTYN
ncbi:hypothetical protein BKA57DRAFT_449950 [Linnemannia elongata]|nr:hypothetical protein BGZ88_004204 [Linnemannia elongata]KAG0379327.1 hypothetical protein BGX24_000818 [Mortierella sp. AD032]KAH7056168.1 hypothetical protein BKA57DRAFT_449950 [Linnemannia elongata]